MRAMPCGEKFCAKADMCALVAIEQMGWQAQEQPKKAGFQRTRRYCVMSKSFCGRAACNRDNMCEDTVPDQDLGGATTEDPANDPTNDFDDDSAWHVTPDGERVETRNEAIRILIAAGSFDDPRRMSTTEIREALDGLNDNADPPEEGPQSVSKHDVMYSVEGEEGDIDFTYDQAVNYCDTTSTMLRSSILALTPHALSRLLDQCHNGDEDADPEEYNEPPDQEVTEDEE